MTGVLVESIALDAPVAVSNGMGGIMQSWTQQVACRARYRFLRAGETVLQGRLAGQNTVVVRVRASMATRAITPEWRMRDLRTAVVYNIRSVIPTSDRLYLDLTCESGVAV